MARAAVVLQRGRHLEEVEAPKYSLFHRRYNGPFANGVRVDAGWNSDQVRRE